MPDFWDVAIWQAIQNDRIPLESYTFKGPDAEKKARELADRRRAECPHLVVTVNPGFEQK